MHYSTLLSAGLMAASAVVASPAAPPARKHKRRLSFSPSDKVVMYWGQSDGISQIELADACNNPSIDVVVLAFLNIFPDQGENGYPGTNFASACDGTTFQTPQGGDTQLLKKCSTIGPNAGIDVCRANGKKVLLSIGGAYPRDYYLASQDSATSFADFLTYSFGPPNTAINPATSAAYPRPFGDSYVDGFDLDIESDVDDVKKQQNYDQLISRLRNNSPSVLVSAAPQCVIPDAHFSNYISTSVFDYIFVQLYNTDGCSARDYVDAPSSSNTFSTWLSQNYASIGTKVFAGLPAAKLASNGLASGEKYYLEPTELKTLINGFFSYGRWGGLMFWEATFSSKNTYCGKDYAFWAKKAMADVYNGDMSDIAKVCQTSSSSSVISSFTSSSVSSASSVVISSSTTVSSSSSVPVSPSSSSSVISSSTSSSFSSVSSVVISSSSAVSSSSSVPVSPPSSSAIVSTSSGSFSAPSSSKPTSSAANSPAPSSSKPGSTSAPVTSKPETSSTSSIVFPTHGPFFNSSRPIAGPSSSFNVGPRPTSSNGGSGPLPPSSSSPGGGSGPSKPSSSGSGSGPSKPSSSGSGSGPSKPSSPGSGSGPSKPSSKGGDGSSAKPTVSSKSGSGGYWGGVTSTVTKTATWVDTCPTGLTTKTYTWTKTCSEGEDPWATTADADVWTTVTVYTVINKKTTTITLTKPWTTPAAVPAKPTEAAGSEGSWAKPAGTSTLVVYVTPVPASEYWAAVGSKPSDAASPVKPSGGAAPAAGAWPASSVAAAYSANAKPLSASNVAAFVPTGTGSWNAKPAQFTGAANRMNVGAGLLAAGAMAVLAF